MRRREVRRTYDRIAEHFAQTRAHAWPDVERFIETETEGSADSTALDLGCGNGRHAELLVPHVDTVVCADLSRSILETARDRTGGRTVELLQTDAADLPLRSESVDVAVYIAALHHLPTRATRLRSLDELARVLAPSGRALVSVWSTVHPTFEATTGFDTTVDWTLPDGETVDRFYHIYDPEEFERDVRDSAGDVQDVFTSNGNCYAVLGTDRD
ncbi:class I SAM-dependent methyltransferase [Halocatena pleomorpha]|uniref:Class I SAM-dependent methyltransferase n=1 Tax=Halocatena pleomorpha TaxID=1785090 RepID=A0A3P3RDL2_9EURY|nr:class I SAM-dependent methyltransferase [Halocatena pleomorpha]RRJ31029.1 class I SAM-dependent methyltransferase [Halocatena pleomorpha]